MYILVISRSASSIAFISFGLACVNSHSFVFHWGGMGRLAADCKESLPFSSNEQRTASAASKLVPDMMPMVCNVDVLRRVQGIVTEYGFSTQMLSFSSA